MTNVKDSGMVSLLGDIGRDLLQVSAAIVLEQRKAMRRGSLEVNFPIVCLSSCGSLMKIVNASSADIFSCCCWGIVRGGGSKERLELPHPGNLECSSMRKELSMLFDGFEGH